MQSGPSEMGLLVGDGVVDMCPGSSGAQVRGSGVSGWASSTFVIGECLLTLSEAGAGSSGEKCCYFRGYLQNG